MRVESTTYYTGTRRDLCNMLAVYAASPNPMLRMQAGDVLIRNRQLRDVIWC